ncbi:hypothetical protein [Acidiferrobacter sp.]
MKILITQIPQMDHSAVARAAALFYAHIEACSLCDLQSERLCETGVRLREKKYQAAAKKWRR